LFIRRVHNTVHEDLEYYYYQDIWQNSAWIYTKRLLFTLSAVEKRRIRKKERKKEREKERKRERKKKEFPESTVTGEETWVDHFTPQTKKLECNGITQLFWHPKNSKCASLLEKLWPLHSGMQKESSMMNSCTGAKQSMQKPTVTCCDDWGATYTKRPGHVSWSMIMQHASATPQRAHWNTWTVTADS